MEVKKRTGGVVPYDGEKIIIAVEKAMAETKKGVDHGISKAVVEDVEATLTGDVIDIESIQDAVEVSLMKRDPETAKKYILYREERTRLREHGWDMTDLQRDIYEKKYRFHSENFEGFLERVSGGQSTIKKKPLRTNALCRQAVFWQAEAFNITAKKSPFPIATLCPKWKIILNPFTTRRSGWREPTVTAAA